MNKINKLYDNINIRISIYSEAGIGILANTTLLLFHVSMCLQGHRPRLTDPAIALLALIHLLRLVVMGFLATDIFFSWGRWDDITCKVIMFLHRSLRGFSLCATSLLSVLQAITLSPRNSCLAKFKHKSPQYIFLSFLCVSVFYTCLSSHLLVYVTVTPNWTSPNLTFLSESCVLLPMSNSVGHTFVTLLTVRDGVLIGLMALSSVYMVAFLFRHKRHSQRLHSASLSPKASPEQRATQTVLVLMGFFVVMSIFDSIISYFRTMSDEPSMYFIQILVAHGYATGSALVVLGREKRLINILRSVLSRMVHM